jgi:hypothetical protein
MRESRSSRFLVRFRRSRPRWREGAQLPRSRRIRLQIRDLLVRAYSLPGEETRSAEHATALRRDDL